MDLFEFEGKKLLRDAGIATPQNTLVCAAQDAISLPLPYVLKAQVLTGGRGKAGGIQVCTTKGDVERLLPQLLGMDIKGHTVASVMAEEMVKPEQELYLSISSHGEGGKPLIMASPMGGMDIEQVAKDEPDKLLKLTIDPFAGIHGYQYRLLADMLPMADPQELKAFIDTLYASMKKLHATLIEINPLGVVQGKLMALDAKVTLDDDAERLNSTLVEQIRKGRTDIPAYSEPFREPTTITFVPLSGDIGLISDGAGTGMLTLDLVGDAGGKLASFCELGGVTNADVMYRAMEKTFFPGNTVTSVLVVLIGGFNRMDDMANGITRYMQEHKINVPIFTRMCGTMEEEGLAIMKEHGLPTYLDLVETVTLSVAASGAK